LYRAVGSAWTQMEFRVVKTEVTSSGTQVNSGGSSQPINVDNTYTRALPSSPENLPDPRRATV
jgi:hypothetical protein